MPVMDRILKNFGKQKMHFSLLDPDPEKNGLEELAETAERVSEFGTDAVMVGGSTNVEKGFLDRSVQEIKKSGLPVILFPGDVSGVTEHADAIFFMSLLNSKNPYWITGAQAKGASLVRESGLESIPMAYLIVEPGMTAGEVGEADLIRDPETAASYAMAAEHMGMKLVYLEAGSGAPEPVRPEIVKEVRNSTKIPLIVGGGIRSAGSAKAACEAGADIIVTGTAIEDDAQKVSEIIEAVHS